MKIPFLPYCIVPLKAVSKGREQKSLATKQIARFLEQNHSLVRHIRTLPRKYWLKEWQVNDIQNQKGQTSCVPEHL